MLPRLGDIVWATVEDANGFRKRRPAVVITATDEIAAQTTARLAAVTTRLTEPLPDDYVLLPWSAQGNSRSGLKRRCAAVATWLLEAPTDELEVVGALPAAVLNELLAKIAEVGKQVPPSSD